MMGHKLIRLSYVQLGVQYVRFACLSLEFENLNVLLNFFVLGLIMRLEEWGLLWGHESKNWKINSVFQSALSFKIMISKCLHLCIGKKKCIILL